MKFRFLAIMALMSIVGAQKTYSQDLLGVKTSRYLGGTSAIFNPANIADSRHKVSLNLIGLDLMLGNSHVTFDKNTIKDMDGIGSIFKDAVDPISAKVNANILGPSLMIKLNRNNSIAINTRIRTLVDVNQIDQELFKSITVDASDLEAGIKNINSPYKQYVNASAWGEIGFTYARTLLDLKSHYLKAGVTAKYLMPVTNYSIKIENLNGDIIADPVNETANLMNASGRIGFEQSGMDIENFEDIKATDVFKSKQNSVGFDFGLVYEYRPNHDKYRDVETGDYNVGKEKYAFRLGVSVLDFGKMKFDRNAAQSGTFDIDINGAEAYDLRDFEGVDIPGGLISHLRARPQYFTELAISNPNSYTLKMPTNLNVDLDVRLLSWLYVNGAIQKFMDTENEFGQSLAALDNFTITPRIEFKTFGLYVPINNSDLTGTNIGAAFRFGGLYIGSSNAVTIWNKGSKNLNVYVGFAVGFGSKK